MNKETRSTGELKKPRLAAEKIESNAASQCLTLYNNGRTLEIQIEGDFEEARNFLQSLTNPDNLIWQKISQTGEEHNLSAVVETLNQYGWIEEDNTGLPLLKAAEEIQYDTLIKEAVAWLVNAMKNKEKPEGTFFLNIYVDAIQLLTESASGKRSVTSLHQLPVTEQQSMPVIALMLLLRSWQHSAPATLAAFTKALGEMLNVMRIGLIESKIVHPGLTGMEDLSEMRGQLWAVCCLMMDGVDNKSLPLYQTYTSGKFNDDTGLNTVIHAESVAESLITGMGEPILFEAIENRESVNRCAANIFLHQHFITTKYLRAITTFLRFHVKQAVHKTGFEYLLEEMGHDEHEREACLTLGLTDEDIARFSPLPWFAVYSEILTYLCEVNPLSFCLSIAVAEGMPGQKKLLTDALSAQGIDDPDLAVHTELDLNLNHSYYPRKLAAGFPWIAGSQRKEALEYFLFVLELSQRGWVQLANHASSSLQLVPEPFYASYDSLQPILKTNS